MNDSGFLLISRTVRLPLNKYLKTHANVKITWITESVIPKQYFFMAQPIRIVKDR